VQADPIRAPARAQDLTLRHRVKGYRAGDLERHYAAIAIEEDFFLNYGFVTRSLHALMHPRSKSRVDRKTRGSLAQRLLAFVRERGPVHPREVDDHFAHGRVVNYWGGSSSATTHMLEAMHYTGLLRVARRDGGSACTPRDGACPSRNEAQCGGGRRGGCAGGCGRAIYAPLPASSLSIFTRRLRYAVPQWTKELTGAIQRARQRLRTCAGRRCRLVLASPARIHLKPWRPTWSGCSRRSTRWSTIGALRAVVGLDVSVRSLHACRAAQAAATTRCRCSGATGSSAGGMCR
jgi:uncharacterized protein YcaQ